MPDAAEPPPHDHSRTDPSLPPEPAAPVPASDAQVFWAILGVTVGLAAWGLAIFAFFLAILGEILLAVVAAVLAFALAIAAMASSAYGAHYYGHHHAGWGGASASGAGCASVGGLGTGGLLLGKGLVGIGLLFAVVQASGLLVLPLLLLLLGVLAYSPRCGGGWDDVCCDVCCGWGSASCCGCEACCGCRSCCDCGCDGCCDCGGCSCATAAGATGAAVVAAQAAGGAPTGWLARWRAFAQRRLAHHPDTPAYAHDCYRILGARVCIGCATTYPVFLLATALLTPLAGLLAPHAWLGLGTLAASAQAVSSAGLARHRAAKAAIKTLLGLGLAAILVGVRAAPWSPALQVGILAAVLALSLLSAVPRARRMRRAAREHTPDCPMAAPPGPKGAA